MCVYVVYFHFHAVIKTSIKHKGMRYPKCRRHVSKGNMSFYNNPYPVSCMDGMQRRANNSGDKELWICVFCMCVRLLHAASVMCSRPNWITGTRRKKLANESTHVSRFCADQVVAARQIHGTRDDAKCYAADQLFTTYSL